jgi:hypothetical protein
VGVVDGTSVPVGVSVGVAVKVAVSVGVGVGVYVMVGVEVTVPAIELMINSFDPDGSLETTRVPEGWISSGGMARIGVLTKVAIGVGERSI